VVEKLVDFGEAVDGARLYRVRWIGYEAHEDTWNTNLDSRTRLFEDIGGQKGALIATKTILGNRG
jgi:hypothetical protein